MKKYLPEGYTTHSSIPNFNNQLELLHFLEDSKNHNKILCSKAIMCDINHNLHIDFGFNIKGLIPYHECAIGMDNNYKDVAIISRVNKIVCFLVKEIKYKDNNIIVILSRKDVQEICFNDYIKALTPGMIIKAKVSHLESFGCFVDIGCGIISFIPIDLISVSRINHAKDRFYVGQNINAIVVANENGRIYLSHKELLGTWDENAALFEKNQTVCGIVRSVESYGIFIELTPNLTGLAELKEDVYVGQYATVFIKNIIPEKMKIKLILIDSYNNANQNSELKYFLTEGTINKFNYSSYLSDKNISTEFNSLSPILN